MPPTLFNNLVISAEGATNPIVPNRTKVTNVKLFTFFILFLNIFELFVTIYCTYLLREGICRIRTNATFHAVVLETKCSRGKFLFPHTLSCK
jgi:hypothetical protein